MSTKHPLNIVIVGGSLGGLFAGIALKRLGHNIRILERNPTPLLHDQGAGIVAGPDVQAFFSKYDATKTPIAVTSRQRLYLDRKGHVISRENSVQKMTSWDLVYHILRANFDRVESEYCNPTQLYGEGSATYEHGNTVLRVAAPSSFEPVQVTFKSKSGEEATVTADTVIAADGGSSIVRKLFYPAVERTYAGYVAWRGTVPEAELSESAINAFAEKFTFYHSNGVQILGYLIPGPAGTLKPGERLVNWVWYCNYVANSPAHIELMTDRDGKHHHITLPPGGIRDAVWEKQKSLADDALPPQFAEIVRKTKIPFVQAITDVLPSDPVLCGGKVLLIGDALAGFRPHTASSTNQAALDAMALAEFVGGDISLEIWEDKVMKYAKRVQEWGVEMGNRSQFGSHPLAD